MHEVRIVAQAMGGVLWGEYVGGAQVKQRVREVAPGVKSALDGAPDSGWAVVDAGRLVARIPCAVVPARCERECVRVRAGVFGSPTCACHG